jgi:hypothetical protein
MAHAARERLAMLVPRSLADGADVVPSLQVLCAMALVDRAEPSERCAAAPMWAALARIPSSVDYGDVGLEAIRRLGWYGHERHVRPMAPAHGIETAPRFGSDTMLPECLPPFIYDMDSHRGCINIIVGPRRSGKSTLLYDLIDRAPVRWDAAIAFGTCFDDAEWARRVMPPCFAYGEVDAEILDRLCDHLDLRREGTERRGRTLVVITQDNFRAVMEPAVERSLLRLLQRAVPLRIDFYIVMSSIVAFGRVVPSFGDDVMRAARLFLMPGWNRRVMDSIATWAAGTLPERERVATALGALPRDRYRCLVVQHGNDDAGYIELSVHDACLPTRTLRGLGSDDQWRFGAFASVRHANPTEVERNENVWPDG